MKSQTLQPSPGAWNRGNDGFTLPELMVSMAIFSLLLAGLIATQIFGIKLYEIARAKLGASYQARTALSTLILEVRSGKSVKVGAGTVSSFAETASGTPQQGSALQICLSTNTNDFIRYFLDVPSKSLKRCSSASTNVSVIATSISNSVVFASEDYSGNILTNNQNNRVIGITLQFYQLESPSLLITQGALYDFYQLRTKVTRRALE